MPAGHRADDRASRRVDRPDLVADRDRTILKDVHPDAAPVDELAQHRPGRVALDDSAGLAQSHPAALELADGEVPPNQAV
jgi:hypothetical protein